MTTNDKNYEKFVKIPNLWMVRPCEEYIQEYQVCSSLKGKFYQLYVKGEVDPNVCKDFLTNFEDCQLWSKNADEQAATRIIEREQIRCQKRIDARNANDVWEKRTSPPENWNSPLPQHLKELSDTSLLTSENMEDGMTLSVRTRKIGGLLTTFLPSCSIM